MNPDDDEEQEEVRQIVIPKIKILAQDLEMPKRVVQVEENLEESPVHREEKKEDEEPPKKVIDKILEYLAEILADSNINDKDIAIRLKKKLDEDPELMVPSVSVYEKEMEETGVWQVVIGRQFAASITFDAKYLFYFQLEETGKYYLLFRS